MQKNSSVYLKALWHGGEMPKGEGKDYEGRPIVLLLAAIIGILLAVVVILAQGN